MEKILWVVDYDNVQTFAKAALQAGATGVAIRTDNDLATALKVFHGKGIKVYGWRWPSAQRDAAMREADRVATAFHSGLDGYYVDPEGEPGQPYDWNRPGLEGLADDFCSAIVDASEGRVFGVTSHYRAKAVFAQLPWSTFFRHAGVFLPQAYWRVAGGTVGTGVPADNYDKAIAAWSAAGAPRAQIVPMAGELALVRPSELAAYARAADKHGVRQLHFYTYEKQVPSATWAAIAAL